jgi:hypothetical protein
MPPNTLVRAAPIAKIEITCTKFDSAGCAREVADQRDRSTMRVAAEEKVLMRQAEHLHETDRVLPPP